MVLFISADIIPVAGSAADDYNDDDDDADDDSEDDDDDDDDDSEGDDDEEEEEEEEISIMLVNKWSDNQWLNIGLSDGWPTLSVQLPVTGVLDPAKTTSQTPARQPSPVQATKRLVELDIRVPPSRRSGGGGAVRLDDNQWHEIRLHRTGKALRLTVDGELLVYRRLAGEQQMTSLLRTHTITLGGSVNVVGLGYDVSPRAHWDTFKGRMIKALFSADGLTMDILRYTKTEQHGFRIVSNDLSSDEAVLFDEQCQKTVAQLDSTSSGPIHGGVSFRQRDLQNAYIKLRLPSSSVQKDLRQYLPGDHVTEGWINIVVNCKTTETEGGLLFLLEPAAFVFARQTSLDTVPLATDRVAADRMRLLGAEFRNRTLNLIVQTSLTHSYIHTMDLPVSGAGNIQLEVAYQIVQLTDDAPTETEWPIVRVRLNPDDTWIHIGPGKLKPRNLELISKEVAESYLENENRKLHVLPQDKAVTWFGRDMWLGGMNFSHSSSGLMRYAKLSLAHLYLSGHCAVGSKHSPSVTVNGIPIDLVTYVNAHHKSRGLNHNTTAGDHGIGVIQVGCADRPQGEVTCVDANSIGFSRSGPSLVMCRNNARCAPGWNRVICDCFGTLHTGPTCERATNILGFNGRQLVRLGSPDCGRSRMENILFAFRTDQRNVFLLSTSPSEYRLQAQIPSSTSSDRSHSDESSLVVKRLLGQLFNQSTRMELSLVNGQVQITYKIHGSELMFQLPKDVANNEWHVLKLHRNDYVLTTELDGVRSTRIRSGSHDSWILESTALIYSATETSSIVVKQTKVVTNTSTRERRIQLSAYPVQFQGTDRWCSVGLFTHRGTIELPLRLGVRTWASDGLLMLNTDRQGGRFLHLALKSGQVRLAIKLAGSQTELAKVDIKINDGRWHFITISRLGSVIERVYTVAGCLGGFSMNDRPAVDMLREFQVPADLTHVKCKNAPSPGCQEFTNPSNQCATTVPTRPTKLTTFNSIPWLSDWKQQPGSPCKNAGECFELWGNVRCRCEKTTFKGAQCNQDIEPPDTTDEQNVEQQAATEDLPVNEQVLRRSERLSAKP
ncbi:unnamed protein product [Echinostoma caproni]|uniref:LAM_G_DOMAIN domain-containing protein n=1 Tax=Echinostoma caproni TaxID=27848 RepID=A0A183A7L3_9TREM|nr:unnamed protein product [Echinostoma caproni]